jgi:sec-independent protein translocase protein TatA
MASTLQGLDGEPTEMIPGTWEWIIIIVVILVVFGARRIPEIGKSLGSGIRGFRKELKGDDDTTDDSDTDASQAPNDPEQK